MDEWELIADYLTEIQALVALKAEHVDDLHETEAAKDPASGLRFCPGCRLSLLGQRLSEVLAERGKPAFRGRDPKAEVLKSHNHQRDFEAVRAVAEVSPQNPGTTPAPASAGGAGGGEDGHP